MLGHEGAPVYSMATLRILASMPSRTIGEWDPFPSDPGLGWGFWLKIYRSQSRAPSAPTSPYLLPGGPAQPQAASLGSKKMTPESSWG